MTIARRALLSLTPCVLMAFGCSGPPPLDDILDKAIEAHGGKQNILKPRMGYMKMVGIMGGKELSTENYFATCSSFPTRRAAGSG